MFGGSSNRWEDGADRSTRSITQGAIGRRSVVGLSAPRMWPRTSKMRRGFASWRTPDSIWVLLATGWRLPSFSTTRTSRTSSFSTARRRTSQKSYGPRLISAPNVTTLLHANVTQLRLDSASGRLRELEVSTLTARTFVIRPRAAVLAAGGIENRRLLLASRSDRAGGVGNEFDMVGRCFMEHLHMPTGHFFPAKTDVNTTFYHKAVMQDARVRGVIIPTASAQDRHRLLATSIALRDRAFPWARPSSAGRLWSWRVPYGYTRA